MSTITQDILRAAHDDLEKNGRAVGHARLVGLRKGGTFYCRCAGIAIAEAAAFDSDERADAELAIAAVLGKSPTQKPRALADLFVVTEWNDDPATTDEEVLRVFRAAADAEEAS
jgi:hypothetical protein